MDRPHYEIFILSKLTFWKPLLHWRHTEWEYPFRLDFDTFKTHGEEVEKLISADTEKDPPQFPASEIEHVVMG